MFRAVSQLTEPIKLPAQNALAVGNDAWRVDVDVVRLRNAIHDSGKGKDVSQEIQGIGNRDEWR
jgi:hypothetical protein